MVLKTVLSNTGLELPMYFVSYIHQCSSTHADQYSTQPFREDERAFMDPHRLLIVRCKVVIMPIEPDEPGHF